MLLTLSSCSNADDAVQSYLIGISEASGNPAQLDSLREVISTNATDNERHMILEAVRDSSDIIRATALFVTVIPDKAASEIISSPSRNVLKHLSNLYMAVGDTSANSALKASLLDQFNSLKPSEAADFLVAVASPEENGQGLRPGDEELEHEIDLRYSGDSAKEFHRAVNANKLYKGK